MRTLWIPCLVLLALLAVLPAARASAEAAPEAEVRRVLAEQTAAWNRRDLEGYMAGYWQSPALTFFAGSAVTHGWQATLLRYRQRYQSAGKEMGTLSFGDVAVEVLGPSAALARGQWRLRMSDGKESRGLFTVIFRRLPEGWRIIHDHSC
jgi:beta-aspartyl-peptidase (threonine type)